MAPPTKQSTVNITDFDPFLEFEPGDDRQPEKPRKKRSRCAPVVLWQFELGSVLLSIATFIALILFLRVYQGRSLSEWTLPLSLNAIIAILSTVFKSSVVMPVGEGIGQLKWIWFARRSRSLAHLDHLDVASKGPWGSITLLLGLLTRDERPWVVQATAPGAALTFKPQVSSCFRRNYPSPSLGNRALFPGSGPIPQLLTALQSWGC